MIGGIIFCIYKKKKSSSGYRVGDEYNTNDEGGTNRYFGDDSSKKGKKGQSGMDSGPYDDGYS
eukprot:CAMPEP_0170543698 /NCGR_PEP_ID=MMETSP0211-20121228/2724_1 /TAXON_ID=311385 /ORGANISM="Pseudokeronopsis sp., Strain OXSARD2" /LENGTH=62 /DNA_ID=CAMNT_0010847141 /DNA_START=780 /DNA_END=968 /DNA_ORIENTATION=+